MLKIIKTYTLVLLIFFSFSNLALADNVFFIDFSKVLNNSKAGAEAKEKLKKKFLTESEKFKKLEESLKKEEADLIAQKKALSNEDYQNKIDILRKRVLESQKNKQDSLNDIARSRNDAKQELLKAINPIIKKYMEKNNIRLIVDKESIILGDVTLEITNQIIEILNQEVKSIKVN